MTVRSTAVLVGTALQCATGTSRHVSEGILTHLVTCTRDTSDLDTLCYITRDTFLFSHFSSGTVSQRCSCTVSQTSRGTWLQAGSSAV